MRQNCSNGGNTRDIERRQFVFVTLLDLRKLVLKYAKFPQRGRVLGHVTPEISEYDSTYLQNHLS